MMEHAPWVIFCPLILEMFWLGAGIFVMPDGAFWCGPTFNDSHSVAFETRTTRMGSEIPQEYQPWIKKLVLMN